MDPRSEGQRVVSIYTIQRPQQNTATSSLSYEREPRRVGHRANDGYSNRAFVPETRVPHPGGLAPPPYDDFPPVYSPVYDDVPRYSELDAESGRRLAQNNRQPTVQRVRRPGPYGWLMPKFLVVCFNSENEIKKINRTLKRASLEFVVTDSLLDISFPMKNHKNQSRVRKKGNTKMKLKTVLDDCGSTTSDSEPPEEEIAVTGTAEIKVEDHPLALFPFIKQRDGKPELTTSLTTFDYTYLLDPNNNSTVTRSARNIKRYRRQLCHHCQKTFVVPFQRSKMDHAATHSLFKRYACLFCDRRSSHKLTIRQHVLNTHGGLKGSTDAVIGYKDLMNEEEQIMLLKLAELCFPTSFEM